MGFATFLPFTADEHLRFIEALERIDPDAACSGREWANIANYVGGQRSVNEVKLHAHNYFLRLQAKCASSTQTHVCAVDESASHTLLWTASEDAVFEQSLAIYDEGDEKRWDKIAAHLPEKSADDVRRRYEQLILDVARIEAGEDVVLQYRAEDDNEDTATHQCATMQVNHHSQPDPPGRRSSEEQSAANSGVKRLSGETEGQRVIRPLPQRGVTAEGGQHMCGGQTYRHAQQQQQQQTNHQDTHQHHPQQHRHPPSQQRQQQQGEPQDHQSQQREPPPSPGPDHDLTFSARLNGPCPASVPRQRVDARGGGGVQGFSPHQQQQSPLQNPWLPTPPLANYEANGHNAAGSMQHKQPQENVCGAPGSLMVVDDNGNEMESFEKQPQQQQQQHMYQEPRAYNHQQQKEGKDDDAHHERQHHYMQQQQQQFVSGPLIVTEDCAAFAGMDFGGDAADVGQGMHDFISHLHGSPPPRQDHHHNHSHIHSNDHHQELRHQHSQSHEHLDMLQPHPPPQQQDYQQHHSQSHDKMGADDSPTGFENHQQPTPDSAVPPVHPELLSRFSDPGMYSAGSDSHAQHAHGPLPLPSPPSLTSDRPLTLDTIMTDMPPAPTATESTAVSPFSSSAMLPLTPSGHELAAELVAGLAAALAGGGGGGGGVCAATDVHAFDAQTQTMECGGGGGGGGEREAGGPHAHAHTHDAHGTYGHDAVLRLPQRGETPASVQSHGDICVLGGSHDELCLGIDVDMSDAEYLLTQSGRNSVADGVMYAAACTAGGRGGGCGDIYANVHGMCMDTVTAAGGCGAATGGDDHGGGGGGDGAGGGGGGSPDAARGGREGERDMHDDNRSRGCTSTSPLSTSDDAMSLSSHVSTTTTTMPAAVHTHAHAPATAEEQKAFLAALAAHVGVSTEQPQLAATATAK